MQKVLNYSQMKNVYLHLLHIIYLLPIMYVLYWNTINFTYSKHWTKQMTERKRKWKQCNRLPQSTGTPQSFLPSDFQTLPSEKHIILLPNCL